MISRRQLLAGLSTLALNANAQSQKKPHIIWIMADDLGIGDLGCYGQKHIRTPNIDKLAAEGLRFTDAYAGCTVCAPSRSVLMTGLHTGHTPIRSNPGGVPLLASERTVAEYLKEAGYTNALFGKWGLGDIGTTGVPWKHGFDEFFGFLHQAHAHFQYPRYLYLKDEQFPLEGNTTPGRKTYANDAMMARALNFIERQQAAKPFYLYVALTIPHFEPHVPEDSLAEYRGKVPNGKPYSTANGRLAPQSELGPAYAGMVSRIDRYVGQVMAMLAKRGLDRDTLVFFTSDNGGIMARHEDDYFNNMAGLRGQKGTMYEGGLRVPMIARWPGRIKPGTTSDFSWCFQDFMPTALELAGAKPPKGIDGFSIVPTLFGRSQKPHEYLYWEHNAYDSAKKEFRKGTPPQALRQSKWKMVRPAYDAPVELYDLAADPGESKNLAASQPKIAAELEAKMRAARVEPRPQEEPSHRWWDARS